MADTKISGLVALTGAGVSAANDLLAIVDTSASTTKYITVAELAVALGSSTLATDADLTTHTADTTSVHGIADTSQLATLTNVSDHAADTTSVHGIADTSVLETTTGAQTKVDSHVNDANGAHAATAISVDSTNLTGVGTDLQTVLEELEDQIGEGTTFSGDASDVPFTPAGTIAATDTQAAVEEVASEAASALSTHAADTTSIHGIADTSALETTSGAQTKVDTHVNDGTAAHAASAISADSTNLVGTATDVQGVLDELDNSIAEHIADATAAHAATAIDFTPAGSIAATTVQAAIEEVAAEAGSVQTAVNMPLYVGDPAGSVIVTGDSQAIATVPPSLNGATITDAYAQITTTSSSGNPTVQVHRRRSGSNVDVFSTALSIDANELNSSTAASAVVINASNDDLATGDELHLDVDTAGTGTKGLVVWLEITPA